MRSKEAEERYRKRKRENLERNKTNQYETLEKMVKGAKGTLKRKKNMKRIWSFKRRENKISYSS